MGTSSYTAVVEKEGGLYVALYPEFDMASQGATVEEATANLKMRWNCSSNARILTK